MADVSRSPRRRTAPGSDDGLPPLVDDPDAPGPDAEDVDRAPGDEPSPKNDAVAEEADDLADDTFEPPG
jgi:hypothetical protein